jgi:hypothetical protein
MSYDVGPLDLSFQSPIGVDVKGSLWPCVEVPGSTALFGTGKSLRVDLTVDGHALDNVGLMPTGNGGHMLSLSAKVRKALGKDIGDNVAVTIRRRLT